MEAGTAAYSPAITFIDGEYWGLYGLREHYTSDYFVKHFGVDKTNIVYLEFIWGCDNVPNVSEGTEADVAFYEEMYGYLSENDFSDPEVYRHFESTYMDLDSFIDFCIVHIYSANKDWPGNNNKMWRVREPEEGNPYADGRWRYLIHDVDGGMKDLSYDMFAHLSDRTQVGGMAYEARPRWATLFFRKLMENEDFFRRFTDRLLHHLNSTYERSRVRTALNTMQDRLLPHLVAQKERWNLDTAYPLAQALLNLKTFALSRPRVLLNEMAYTYGLAGVARIDLEGLDPQADWSVRFGDNEFDLSGQEAASFYDFLDRPVTLAGTSPRLLGFEVMGEDETAAPRFLPGGTVVLSPEEPMIRVRPVLADPTPIPTPTPARTTAAEALASLGAGPPAIFLAVLALVLAMWIRQERRRRIRPSEASRQSVATPPSNRDGPAKGDRS